MTDLEKAEMLLEDAKSLRVEIDRVKTLCDNFEDWTLLTKFSRDVLKLIHSLELKIIRYKAGTPLGGEMTLEEITPIIGVKSRERIRQIETNAIKKLRHPKIVKKFYDYMKM